MLDLAPHLVAGLDFSTLPQQLVTGLLIGAIYALVALGYTMVYGVLKLINFAHGEVFMLGAYVSLFISWALGYTPANTLQNGSWGALALMLFGSMVACGLIGALIERLAYRPMRSQPRISSLITAIGVSLLLQYGGQIFLLEGKPQNVDPKVSPVYSGSPLADNVTLHLRPASKDLLASAEALKEKAESTKAAFASASAGKDPFNLPDDVKQLRTESQDAERAYNDAVGVAENSAVSVHMPKGQLIMLGTTLVLMALLTYLVLFTKQGRAMRAVSHDFDAASLMGISVNSIVTFTFVLGSALAGAGAMMASTFQSGTNITTFFGVLPGLKAFVAAVFGGIGNIPGAVLGGLLMGIAENLVVWAGYPGYSNAVAFVILIVVLLFRPGGLLGSSKVEKV
ncbi:branched-chain amino acid ABC transporter permease [bacterium]|nr:MAG: branched-chain amino acid ABC transporter permease [bacterium]